MFLWKIFLQFFKFLLGKEELDFSENKFEIWESVKRLKCYAVS